MMPDLQRPLLPVTPRHAIRRGLISTGRLVCLLAISGIAPSLIIPRQAAAQSHRPGARTAVPTAPKLKEDLRRILSGSEYQPESRDQNSVNMMVKKTIRDMRRRWSQFLKWLGDLFKTGGMVGGSNAVTGVLVTLLLAFLIWIVVRLSRDWKPKRLAGQLFKNDPASLEEGQADIVRDPEIWSRQAAEWAEKQDYRRAYRALFLAIILNMDAVNIISYDRTRSNGDYLGQLRTKQFSALYNVLAPLAGSYDRFWYGRRMAYAGDYANILEVYLALPTLLKNYFNSEPFDKTTSTTGSQPDFKSGKGQAI